MRVTVTIPVLNSSDYLDGCFDNLRKQTYRDFETIFVVDSRTTDDSVRKIESNCDGMNVRCIMQDDGDGLAGARNIGIDNASGEIIWFLDVDDYPYPTFLEELVAIMDENDADIVFCNHFEYRTKRIPEIPDAEYTVRKIDPLDALANFIDLPVHSWSRIQKKKLFDDGIARFVPRPAAEDIEQTIREISVARNIIYYDKPLHVYYKTNKTSMIRNRPKEIEAIEATAKSIDSLFADKTGYPYDELRKHLTERVMRQSAFSKYRPFSEAYPHSYAHELIKGMKKTNEMKVYESSGLLYYIALYPFTHYLWDNKEGTWGRIGK